MNNEQRETNNGKRKTNVWAVRVIAGTLVTMVGIGAGCGQTGKADPEPQERGAAMLTVKSRAFENGAAIPKKYTGEGGNVSPALSWTGVPEGTKELALICDDPDAPTPQPWVHWVLYGLGPEKTGLAEGNAGGGVEGKNGSGGTGYAGPMPPKGHGVHHYHFKVYALGTKAGLAAGATKEQLLAAMKGHILGQGEVMGTYERK